MTIPTMNPRVDHLVFCRFGRSFWHYGDKKTLMLTLALAWSPSLMWKREDVGRLILVGLQIDITLRWPWGQRGYNVWISYGDDIGWRSPISIDIRSDAGEIARRRAELPTIQALADQRAGR